MSIKDQVDRAVSTFLANSPHADVAKFTEITKRLDQEGVLKKPEYNLPMIGMSSQPTVSPPKKYL